MVGGFPDQAKLGSQKRRSGAGTSNLREGGRGEDKGDLSLYELREKGREKVVIPPFLPLDGAI